MVGPSVGPRFLPVEELRLERLEDLLLGQPVDLRAVLGIGEHGLAGLPTEVRKADRGSGATREEALECQRGLGELLMQPRSERAHLEGPNVEMDEFGGRLGGRHQGL